MTDDAGRRCRAERSARAHDARARSTASAARAARAAQAAAVSRTRAERAITRLAERYPPTSWMRSSGPSGTWSSTSRNG